MGKLSIMPYHYNVRCDTNRCANRAQISLGVKGEPQGTYHNLCGECLEDVVKKAPLYMVLGREDVQEHIQECVQNEAQRLVFSFTQSEEGDLPSDGESTVEAPERPEDYDEDAVDKAPEVGGDYNTLGIRALKVIAKDRDLIGYSNLNKEALVALLESADRKQGEGS